MSPRVEVVYATTTEQAIVEVVLPRGATAADAVRASGLQVRFPEIDSMPLTLGIFGERVAHDHPLQAGDRVEIYRRLPADPKEARRRRARRRKG